MSIYPLNAANCQYHSLTPISKKEEFLQTSFMQAIQAWNLEEILNVLKEGQVNPHEAVVPTDHLLAKLDPQIIAEDDYIDLNDYIMPAWLFLTIFTRYTSDQSLREQILDLLKTQIDNNVDARYQSLFESIQEINDLDVEMSAFYKKEYLTLIRIWKSNYNNIFLY